jgi:hypothetical protein
MECVHCKAILKTSLSLKQHQKTAKYCLIKQNKRVEKEYECCFCTTVFTLKSSLHKHVKICKANNPVLREQLQLLNEQFHELSLIKKDLQFSASFAGEDTLPSYGVGLRNLQETYKFKELFPFGEDKPIKAKRILEDTYPITAEYLISFDDSFHRECLRATLHKKY